VDGILNIDKPAGKTSFDLVALVKRLSGERRAGHAGTLDPVATGVVPVCLGRATRIVEFLVEATKTYRAEIELGIATDTYDAAGQIVERHSSALIGRDELTSTLNSFCGPIQQVPPMYSAVKQQGRPLYKLARAGITVPRRSRLVEVHRVEVVNWQPPVVTVDIVCGKGTYIRSIAHDLGQALGCGAYLKNLVRLRCGPFDIRDSLSVAQLEDAFHNGYWLYFLHPVDSVLLHWPAMVVGDQAGTEIRHGRPLALTNGACRTGNDSLGPPAEASPSAKRCRAYDLDGQFIGVLRFNVEREQWQAEKVFV